MPFNEKNLEKLLTFNSFFTNSMMALMNTPSTIRDGHCQGYSLTYIALALNKLHQNSSLEGEKALQTLFAQYELNRTTRQTIQPTEWEKIQRSIVFAQTNSKRDLIEKHLIQPDDEIGSEQFATHHHAMLTRLPCHEGESYNPRDIIQFGTPSICGTKEILIDLFQELYTTLKQSTAPISFHIGGQRHAFSMTYLPHQQIFLCANSNLELTYLTTAEDIVDWIIASILFAAIDMNPKTKKIFNRDISIANLNQLTTFHGRWFPFSIEIYAHQIHQERFNPLNEIFSAYQARMLDELEQETDSEVKNHVSAAWLWESIGMQPAITSRLITQVNVNQPVEMLTGTSHNLLTAAVGRGDKDTCKNLLAQSSQKNIESAFLYALTMGNATIIDLFLERDPALVSRPIPDKTNHILVAVHAAACSGNINIMKLLCSKGANLSARRYTPTLLFGIQVLTPDLTVLDCAITAGHLNMVIYLMTEHRPLFNLEEATNNSLTPLVNAAIFGHREIASYLIEHGADIKKFLSLANMHNWAVCSNKIDLSDHLNWLLSFAKLNKEDVPAFKNSRLLNEICSLTLLDLSVIQNNIPALQNFVNIIQTGRLTLPDAQNKVSTLLAQSMWIAICTGKSNAITTFLQLDYTRSQWLEALVPFYKNAIEQYYKTHSCSLFFKTSFEIEFPINKALSICDKLISRTLFPKDEYDDISSEDLSILQKSTLFKELLENNKSSFTLPPPFYPEQESFTVAQQMF